MSPKFIDSSAELVSFLDDLPDCNGQPPSLYVDLEGNYLSRHGTLSIITILVLPQYKTYLIDVTTLGQKAFTTKSTTGSTLKGIFEDEDMIKVFFDVRNDSDALFSWYNVHLHNVEDLQLFEFASRSFQRRCVHGLAKCIEGDLQLPYSDKARWRKTKDDGRRLFAPDLGGSYAVFDERPMSAAMIEYCAQDVIYMPMLREKYLNKLCDAWYLKTREEAKARVRLSQTPGFNGKGRHMAMGPSGWQMWQPALYERQKRTLFHAAPVEKTPATVSAGSSLAPVDRRDTLAEALEELNLGARKGSAHDSDDSDGRRYSEGSGGSEY